MVMNNANRLKELNGRVQWHPMTHPNKSVNQPPLIMVKGDGAFVEDIDGNRYVDGLGGLWNVNVGHNRAEVKQAIVEQMEKICYYSSFDGMATAPSIELAARILEIAGPEDMAKVFFSSGGSDAVESALKLSRQYWKLMGQPEKTKFVSLKQGYHGVHMGGVSINGSPAFRGTYAPLLPGCFQIDTPWLYRNPWTEDPEELGRICAAQLDRLLEFEGGNTVAAFIAEPVQGAGGVIVPPANYWPLIREVCDRHNVLLIADEVVTGFGRSGSMFGSRGWGVKPDILCLAKGITSGYVPLGATVLNKRIAAAWDADNSFTGVIMHGYTYSGHPVACAAALACLDIVEKEDLPANAAKQGARLLAGLKPLEQSARAVGEVRGKGLMLAVDLVADKKTRAPINPQDGFADRIAEQARRFGAIVRPVGTKLILSPVLVIKDEEVDLLVSALTKAFEVCDA